MIKSVEMFTIVCDNCGKRADKDVESSCWESPESARLMAEYDEWIEVDDKDYCPSCFNYDDEDNLILKNIKP